MNRQVNMSGFGRTVAGAFVVAGFGIWLYGFLLGAGLVAICAAGGLAFLCVVYAGWAGHAVIVARIRSKVRGFDAVTAEHEATISRSRQAGEFLHMETGGLIRNKNGLYVNMALNPSVHFAAEGPGIGDEFENQRWLADRRNGGGGNLLTTVQPDFVPDVPQITDTTGDVLPLLLSLDRILIIGGMGAGKTSAMRRIALERGSQGETIVIDSHAAPTTWPKCCRVVGLGRDYGAVESEIADIAYRMDSRYKRLATGHTKEGDFPTLTLIIDEFTIINFNCKISGPVKSIMCECRKVGIRLVIGGQSDRAASLGLQGNADLVAGFEGVVYLSKDPSTGLRYADVKHSGSKDKIRYMHPGAYVIDARHNVPSGFGSPDVSATKPASRDNVRRERIAVYPEPVQGQEPQRTGSEPVEPGVEPVFETPEMAEMRVAEPVQTGFEDDGADDYSPGELAGLIVKMHIAGVSKNKIIKALLGSKNGQTLGIVNDVIARYEQAGKAE